MVLISPNRLARFDVWLGRDTNPFGNARQPMQGRFALADGGWFGLGLGASREKWQWLSEPHNDFIFAIIGEELGLPGTIVVLVLFAVLTVACYRLVMRTTDTFVRIATAGAMTWIVVQAMVNIGTVIGLLPVIGLPAPARLLGRVLPRDDDGDPRDPPVLREVRTRMRPGPVGATIRPAPHPVRRPVPGPPRAERAVSAGPRSVLLAGGGTAGHVSPLLSLADCLRRRDPDVAVLVLGTAEGLEARLVPERGYPLAIVPKVPLPRRPSADLLRLPGNLRAAVAAAGTAIDQSGAEVVVGFGGYVSTPAYLAARRRRIPVVVHEQNARPGLANRLGARIAAAVAVTFPDTALPHAHVIGMPLRHEIATLDRAALRAEARAGFGLDADRPTVLVTGGSLGAARLNAAFYGAVTALREAGIQVLHVSGLGKDEPVESVPGAAPYVVLPYADRMDLAYAAADLVVARAGANTVCELTAVGLPAVYVPLPIGNGEQRLNARAVVEAGGGVLVDDAEMTARWVADRLVGLASDPTRVAEMAAAAAAVGERGADELLADLVVEAVHGGR